MSNYASKLRDPRWQKKRLEIIQRDGFACCACKAKDHPLNVHHGFYARGVNPWEYSDDTLWTLCEDCHGMIQACTELIHSRIAMVSPMEIARAFFGSDGLGNMIGSLIAFMPLDDTQYSKYYDALMDHNKRVSANIGKPA